MTNLASAQQAEALPEPKRRHKFAITLTMDVPMFILPEENRKCNIINSSQSVHDAKLKMILRSQRWSLLLTAAEIHQYEIESKGS